MTCKKEAVFCVLVYVSHRFQDMFTILVHFLWFWSRPKLRYVRRNEYIADFWGDRVQSHCVIVVFIWGIDSQREWVSERVFFEWLRIKKLSDCWYGKPDVLHWAEHVLIPDLEAALRWQLLPSKLMIRSNLLCDSSLIIVAYRIWMGKQRSRVVYLNETLVKKTEQRS